MIKHLRIWENKIFVRWLSFSALITLILLMAFFITLTVASLPAIKANGFGFLWGKTWDPVKEHFGILPYLTGTLLTSLLALLISAPFSLAAAIFLGEYHREGAITGIFRNTIELLAAIPSVVYGFWGLFTVAPLIRIIELKLHIPSSGLGILTASVVLAIMLIPFSVSLIRQVISMTPRQLKEAAYALGGTQTEVIGKVILPYNISGIAAGLLLSLGRALSETMAVTMLIGNSAEMPHTIFSASNTMASVIANEFTEAISTVYTSSLIEIGLILFLVTMIINLIGRSVIKSFSVN